VLLYEALGYEAPVFGHASLILNEDRQKMSKRDETIIQFVEQYRELGYLPEAIVNFIALLGWSPGGEQELMTLKELEQEFRLDRVIKAPAVFDTQKLEWMNNQYMKAADEDRVVWLALPHLVKAGRLPERMTEEQRQWAYDLIVLHQEKMSYGAQIVELTELFFKQEIDYNEEAQAVLNEEQVPEVLAAFRDKLLDLETWTTDDIKQSLKAVQKETGHKGKKLFMPVRIAVTGQMHGPDLQKTIILLGKDVVIKRLEQLLAS
jgi:nondiscriminating glutamyl-tRNA synthetase